MYLGIFTCLSSPPKITLGNHFGWWEGASCLCFWPLRTIWWFDCHYLCCQTKRKAWGRVMKSCTSRGGRLVPPVYKIWEMLISLGTAIPARCPKWGVVMLCFLSLSCKTLWSYGAAKKGNFPQEEWYGSHIKQSTDWKILGAFRKKNPINQSWECTCLLVLNIAKLCHLP